MSDKPGTNVAVISPQMEESYFRKRRESNIHKYFREYCQSTSIHGFKYLSERRSVFERFFWLILITTSIVACCYVITRIYIKYEESPVIVSFATKQSPLYTIPFPAVTFCPVSKSDKTMFNFTKICHQIADNKTIKSLEERRGQYLSLICDEATDFFPLNKTFTDDFYEEINKIKIPMNQLIVFCKFMGDEVPCEEIFTPILLDEGVCYTFNMLDREDIFKDNVIHFSNYHKSNNKSEWNIDSGYSDNSGIDVYPRRALLSGADNALDVTFLQFDYNMDYVCTKDVQGFSVLLHTPHTIPLLKKQYVKIPHDSAVNVVVQPNMMATSEEVKNFDPIDRECYFTYEQHLKFFKIYTPDNCRVECIANYTLKQCGCVNYYMPREQSTPICGNGNWKCMLNAERDLKLIHLKNNIVSPEDGIGIEDYCDCMPLCTELTYDMEQSQTDWKWREQFLANRMNNEGTKYSRLARLSVFFKLEQFLTSERNGLYGPIDFLANFGGLLGLFTGFSLLSLVEIIYFLTLRVFCNKKRYKIWTGPKE